MRYPIVRRLLAEFLGTMLLVTAVAGSGIMAARLSPDDLGLQLLENSIATTLALPVLILIFAPVSGAHLNPAVTLAAWWLDRRTSSRPTIGDTAGYIAAQTFGAIAGAVLTNAMFGLTPLQISTTPRNAAHLWVGEAVATAGLILLIFALMRSQRANLVPAAVGAWIGAAYWFTSSTSFANPAVTVGRAFTDTFTGISPMSLPGFLAAQGIGTLLGLLAIAALLPQPAAIHRTADQTVEAADATPTARSY